MSSIRFEMGRIIILFFFFRNLKSYFIRNLKFYLANSFHYPSDFKKIQNSKHSTTFFETIWHGYVFLDCEILQVKI